MDHGAVARPGDIDLAPDAMYAQVVKQGRPAYNLPGNSGLYRAASGSADANGEVRVTIQSPGLALRMGMYVDLAFTNVQAGK
jgi:hypothetical protein